MSIRSCSKPQTQKEMFRPSAQKTTPRMASPSSSRSDCTSAVVKKACTPCTKDCDGDCGGPLFLAAAAGLCGPAARLSSGDSNSNSKPVSWSTVGGGGAVCGPALTLSSSSSSLSSVDTRTYENSFLLPLALGWGVFSTSSSR